MMKNKIFYLLLLLPGMLYGQDVLDDYIHFGLENNLALKQKQSDFRRSVEALKEAHSLFYPGISLNARYTVSEGGRVIDFPVGDLLNPVYSTLNTLTSSDLFPVVENQQIKFLRPTEQETKIRITQPLFNTDIYYNSKIKNELSQVGETEFEQYKRELVSEIKKAYYNAAMADILLSVLNDTRKLLLENIRVSKKLIMNDKVTKDNFYRSEAELNKFDQELQVAEKNKKIACAYFNFLLNKPLTDSITLCQPTDLPKPVHFTDKYTQAALQNREELKKLESYKNISDMQVKMYQSGKLPDLFLVADYGIQGENYVFNKDAVYGQASAVLVWNLFEGFSNKAKISQALIQNEKAKSQIEEARKQIELQVITAVNELSAMEKGIVAAESRLINARESFRIVEKKYNEGQISLLEFIDARSTMTQAEENLIIFRFKYLSAYADFEKVTGTSEFE
jgi:outer membrane protein